MVVSAPNMRWKGSRKLVSSATIQEQIFNLGISKETNLELARDLCREAKQELYRKCRSESARNRSCSARSSSCSTQTEAFASVRHLYLHQLYRDWKHPRYLAWWLGCLENGELLPSGEKKNFDGITVSWNKKVTLF